MFLRRLVLFMLMVSAGVLLSCNFFGPQVVGPDEVIHFTVTPGAKPLISWDKGPVGDLTVFEAESGKVLWGLKTEGRDGIECPIRYGTLLEGAQWIINSEIVQGDTIAVVNLLQPNLEYKIFAMRATKYHIGSSRFNLSGLNSPPLGAKS